MRPSLSNESRASWSALARSAPIVGVLAFAFHFSWEVAQCQVFFVHLALSPTWKGMVVATLGDVAMTFLAYVVVATGSRDFLWYLRRPWTGSTKLLLEVFAITLAIAVERMGLDMGRWTYTGGAPMLAPFGVSVVPVLQLALLFPASFAGARFLLQRLDEPLSHQLSRRSPPRLNHPKL